ncbi:hypothetical protein PV620_30260 [Streptomyces sp. ME02-6978a]|uniref:hypothetical protein n=1 Tax=unclassified Streptomyces TaxID=2593676 RepID=UPI0029A55FCE|nr:MULTISPECIES: hypothetical protein [unclassified Streptomyces]MDX3087190.1 hypothetical protein [Streptomyces sp. ME12-02E]MDX3335832.1 hypothetical protein [Streptomyces sp. ME02-6978a]
MAAVPDVLPHLDAVTAALEGAGLTVYVGGLPTDTGWSPPDKFCVLYPEPGMAVRDSLADQRTDFEAVFTVTCVGGDPERALWVTGRVRRALSVPPDVTGRKCHRPEDLGGPPVARDDDVTPPLYFVPVQYRLCSTPA